MKSKEIEELKRELINNENWYNKDSEERKMYEELSLREMIMSCLTYGTDIYTSNFTLKYKDILGEERFNKVLKEQETYFKEHCRVLYNVYIDCEGCYYNSCIED
jgi:hypothetical protein